jgi:hypothetical protein
VDGIQKRLDRVFASDATLHASTRYLSWVEFSFISDHAPVLFQLDIGYMYVAHPFKFNPSCLREESFVDLVHEVCNTHQDYGEEGAQRILVRKLSMLKSRVEVWITERKQKEEQVFENTEEEIALLIKKKLNGDHSNDPDRRLRTLIVP